MEHQRTFGGDAIAGHIGETGSGPLERSCEGRIVRDRLPDSFALDRSESEWLLTLLSAGELRYIFEGPNHAETHD